MGWTVQLLHADAVTVLKDRRASSKCRGREEAGWEGGWGQTAARGSLHAFGNDTTRLSWVPVIQCIHLPQSEKGTLSG